METIQYSLNSDTDYSIDIRLALKYGKSQLKKDSSGNSNLIEEVSKNDKNGIFDSHCNEIYGDQTCILFQTSQDTFQLRYLNSNKTNNIIKREFHTQIPNLLEQSYTVVIVEDIDDDRKEIVAIHFPGNKQ